MMFVWLEGPTSGRVEWRSTCLENGALSLTLTGVTMMQEWSVDSWAMSEATQHLAIETPQVFIQS